MKIVKFDNLFDYVKKRNKGKLDNTMMALEPVPIKKSKFPIEERSIQRISPKIDEFVQALDSASSKIVQNRSALYDHYLRTLMIDTHVTSLLEKRFDNIINKHLVLFKGDEEVEEASYFLKDPKFSAFLRDILMTKFWGMNLFEFNKIKDEEDENKFWFDYKLIPHKHINPYKKHVLRHQEDSEGKPWANHDNVMFLGHPDDLGLLSKITLLSIYKRYGMYAYSNYVDLASENFTVYKGRGLSDDEAWEKTQIDMFRKGGGGVLEVPEGVEVNQQNQSSSSQNTLFENYMKMLKDEMAILILGQTMTTDEGGSYAQAKVHEDEQEDKLSGDDQYILNALNYEFIDYLKLYGFEITKEHKFKFVPTSKEEIKLKLKNYQTLKELGVEFTNDELREQFKELL